MRKSICLILSISAVLVSCSSNKHTPVFGEPVFGTVTEEYPVAKTVYGKVSGENRDGVAIFRGIPYGGSVSGQNRWKPAPVPDSWDGVRECTVNGPFCPQGMGEASISANPSELGLTFNGGHPELFGCENEKPDENCLVLNVLTPGLDKSKRPVMVYFHGGGFTTGTGSLVLGADKLCREEDLVVVGVNHRLNVFGYLYLGHKDPEYSASGSVGIQDLVLSLEWVRDNISAFGGDPDNVTIIGESGGGFKICNLMAMPSAAGLFHHAIVESGSNPVGGLGVDKAAEYTDRLLATLGLSDGDSWKELFNLDAETIHDVFSRSHIPLSPVADGNVLPYYESGTWTPELSKDIPVLVGSSADEFGVFLPIDKFAEDMTWETVKDRAVTQFHVPADKAAEAVEAFRTRNDKNDDPWHVYLKMHSTSTLLGVGAYHQAFRRSKAGFAPVYNYLVEFDSESVFNPSLRCAWHTADLPLQMRVVYHEECEGLSKTMAHAWAAFCRTGSPSTPELEWPAFTPDYPQVMVFDKEVKVMSDPDASLRQYIETDWDSEG